MRKTLLFILLLMPLISAAQHKIAFSFSADGKPLVLNDFCYTSARGLSYQVCQVQYFVSNISLMRNNGTVSEYPDSHHYVDVEIPKTLIWKPSEDFNLDNADTLIFTFGLDSLANRSYRFRNPPENLMFWPDYLGGGYHYMKTNILYISADNQINAFNCHIGRGQVYGADGEPVSYIENAFEVRIPVVRDSDGNAVINLDISSIFDFPNPALFSDYRGIMNNQAAMSMFCENLRRAFR